VSAPLAAPDFRVLFICTGNICRSPAAEVLLRDALAPGAPVVVESAGLRACVGDPVAPDTAVLLPGTAAGHRARQVTPAILRDSDLVLALTREHRAAIAALAPRVVRRLFTLVEFTELAAMAIDDGLLAGSPGPGDSLRRLVSAAPRLRARRRPGPEDDIPDPFRQPPEAHRAAVRAISEAIGRLAPALR
jgi:protein-tyrosine phosphatase